MGRATGALYPFHLTQIEMSNTSSAIGLAAGAPCPLRPVRPVRPVRPGQSTDMVEESEEVVEVEASGRRGVRGGDCTTRSSSECRMAATSDVGGSALGSTNSKFFFLWIKITHFHRKRILCYVVQNVTSYHIA